MWRQAVNSIVVQLGANPLGGFELLSKVVYTGCIRWSESRESMIALFLCIWWPLD